MCEVDPSPHRVWILSQNLLLFLDILINVEREREMNLYKINNNKYLITLCNHVCFYLNINRQAHQINSNTASEDINIPDRLVGLGKSSKFLPKFLASNINLLTLRPFMSLRFFKSNCYLPKVFNQSKKTIKGTYIFFRFVSNRKRWRTIAQASE